MGVDTKVYLNTRWNLDNIKTIIERTQNTKVEIESNHSFAPGYFTFTLPEKKRIIHVHSYTTTPLGTATLLSMRSDEEGKQILKGIAEVVGGMFMDNDVDGKCDFIMGALTDEDGLGYFVKYALVHNGIDNHDIKGLLKSMNDWYDRCDSESKPHDLQKLLVLIGAMDENTSGS
ncbi:MAG: hypothetical protein WC822_06025 [Candidatus Paceibacterota bacterium]|jgi:hypothetical protein